MLGRTEQAVYSIRISIAHDGEYMSTAALIIARLSSSRLPQKNIRPILGRPMIQHLVERIRQAKSIDQIIVTTSVDPSDDALEEVAHSLGVSCYRGPLDNVMARISGAAETHRVDTIVEILGDNPLVHADLIDDTVRLYRENGLDYAATATNEYRLPEEIVRFAIGLRVQVYAQNSAMKYVDYPEYQTNGRHPCAYIFDHPERFKLGFLEATGRWAFLNRPEVNFAVNYPKNFDLIQKIFEQQAPAGSTFPLEGALSYLNQNTSLYDLLGAP